MSSIIITYLVLVLFTLTHAVQAAICPHGSIPARNGSCEVCSPGSYSLGDKCIKCSPGQALILELVNKNDTFPIDHTRIQEFRVRNETVPIDFAKLKSYKCGVCPPGKQYISALYSCKECSNGFFKATSGFSQCLKCPINTYSAKGSANCTACPDNHALLQNGTCATCDPGKFYSVEEMKCMECPSHSFMNSNNVREVCHQCAGNAFSEPGWKECVTCPINQYYMKKSKSCKHCQRGSYYDKDKMECIQCGLNKFSRAKNWHYPDRDIFLCGFCRHGTFARPGSDTCFTCEGDKVFLADIDDCGTCADGETYIWSTAKCGPGIYSRLSSAAETSPEDKAENKA